ncbi:MAG: putative ABC transport system permease protein [Planctomycetota bacterium]|jgi:putative ABC transport system permease protein
MSGLLYLAWRHARAHAARTALLVACIALALWVPMTASVLAERYNGDLRSRADSTPLLVGAPGNRYDLTLAALYFRPSERIDTITYRALDDLQSEGRAVCIPLHQRFTARGYPIVATSVEYAEFRDLRLAAGADALRIGTCALGAKVAEELDLDVGDYLYSDPTELYDIARPPALKMRIVGVYARTETPDDGAVFCDVRTAWVLEGIAHGHEEADKIDEALVLSRTDDSVSVSGALIEYAEVTESNEASFHYHGDTSLLPLTAVLALPHSDKDATLLKSGVNARMPLQAVTPSAVIDDLLGVVFRVKAFFDLVGVFLILTTAALVGLVFLLSSRLRTSEMRTLDRIGAPKSAARTLIGLEVLGTLAVAIILSVSATALTLRLLPDLVASF